MLKILLEKFSVIRPEIETWLESKKNIVGKNPMYSSVDLRSSGFKIVPVDTNLFPAGWNNLCPNYKKKAAELFRKYFDRFFPGSSCIVIIPEDHTRNLFYFSNVKSLQDILSLAGFDVKIGSLNPELGEKTTFQTQENEEITLHKIYREGDNLFVENKKVCQVILNNDFSGGIPEILKGIKQNLLPSPQIGWHHRRKSQHFQIYHQLIDEFAKIVDLDSWFFESYFSEIEGIDIDNAESRKRLAEAVDQLLSRIQKKYQDYNIAATPSVFIKNNAGTYGMSVIRVLSGEEVLNLNQKTRKQMRVGKGSVEIESFLLQEGVTTVDRVQNKVAEPVMYLVNNEVAGGFFRINDEKGDLDNLNSKGMSFSKLCFHEQGDFSNTFDALIQLKDLQFIYHTIATIASLAAGYEFRALIREE